MLTDFDRIEHLNADRIVWLHFILKFIRYRRIGVAETRFSFADAGRRMMAHRMSRVVEHAQHKGADQEKEDREYRQRSKSFKHVPVYLQSVPGSILYPQPRRDVIVSQPLQTIPQQAEWQCLLVNV